MNLERKKLGGVEVSREEIIEKMIKEFKLSVQMENTDLALGSLLNAKDLAKKLGNLDAKTRKRIADILFPIK